MYIVLCTESTNISPYILYCSYRCISTCTQDKPYYALIHTYHM